MPSPTETIKEILMVCRSYTTDPALSQEERDARCQVRRIRGFYQHALIFIAVNAGLVVFNLLSPTPRLWFHWPLLGWGIWLALHGVITLSRGRWFGREWEERKVRELMANKG
jgi:hypothetical protein